GIDGAVQPHLLRLRPRPLLPPAPDRHHLRVRVPLIRPDMLRRHIPRALNCHSQLPVRAHGFLLNARGTDCLRPRKREMAKTRNGKAYYEESRNPGKNASRPFPFLYSWLPLFLVSLSSVGFCVFRPACGIFRVLKQSEAAVHYACPAISAS